MEMDKQPHIRVHRFPEDMGFQEEPFIAVLKPQVRKWFAKMKLFIDAAYPTVAKPAPKVKGVSS
jgi:hypothetical protein